MNAPPGKLHTILSVLAALMLFAAVTALILAGGGIEDGWLDEWKEYVHPFWFFGLLTLAQLAGMPGTPFYLMAPLAYGIPVSLLGTLLSLSATLALAYGLARAGLGPLLRRILDRSGHSIPDLNGNRGVRFTLVLRFLPALPAAAKNYLIALAGVPFPTYFALSLPFSFLYAAPLILLGDSVFERDWTLLLAATAVLLLLGGFGYWLRRKIKN